MDLHAGQQGVAEQWCYIGDNQRQIVYQNTVQHPERNTDRQQQRLPDGYIASMVSLVGFYHLRDGRDTGQGAGHETDGGGCHDRFLPSNPELAHSI